MTDDQILQQHHVIRIEATAIVRTDKLCHQSTANLRIHVLNGVGDGLYKLFLFGNTISYDSQIYYVDATGTDWYLRICSMPPELDARILGRADVVPF